MDESNIDPSFFFLRMRNVTHSGMHVCEFRIDTTDYFLFILFFFLYDLDSFFPSRTTTLFWICFAFFCTTLWVSRTRLPRHRCPFASCTYIGLTPKPYSHYTATGLGCTLPRAPISHLDALFAKGSFGEWSNCESAWL